MNFFDWFSSSYLCCVSVTSFSPFVFNLIPFFSIISDFYVQGFSTKQILFYVYIFDLQTSYKKCPVMLCYYIFFPNHRNTKNRMIQNYSWHTTNRTYLKLVKQVYNNKEILLWDTISRWWLPKAMCWRKGTAASGIVAPMLWKVAKKEKPASRNVNTNMKFSAAIYIDLIGKIFHGQIFP